MSNNKVISFTEEQKKDLAAWYEKCLEWGRDCKPSVRDKSEELLQYFAKKLNIQIDEIVWARGPIEGIIIGMDLPNLMNKVNNEYTIPAFDEYASKVLYNVAHNREWDIDIDISQVDLKRDIAAAFKRYVKNPATSVDPMSYLDHIREKVLRILRGPHGLEYEIDTALRQFLKPELQAAPPPEVPAEPAVPEEHAEFCKMLDEYIYKPFFKNMEGEVIPNVLDQTEKLAKAINNNYWGGQHCSYWWWHYEFCEKIGVDFGEENSKLMHAWADLGRYTSWWVAVGRRIIALERPERQEVDDRQRMHSETGPAILCRDGFAIYAIHGVSVPKHVIEQPQTITLDEIAGETNIEVKRIMTERYGWVRYLRDIGSVRIDQRVNEIENTKEALLQYKHGTSEGKILLAACPSTGRVFPIEVPNEIKTCVEAQLWLSSGLSDRIIAAT